MLSKMNGSKRILVLSFVVLVVFLAGGCGNNVQEQPGNVTPTTGINSTSSSLALTMVSQTMAAMPTATVISTDTPLNPTPTLLPFQVVEGLRVTYVIDGNLYIQDSGKEPVQLTDSGLDGRPIFSDDGERIVFYRGEASDIYSINANGSHEQVLTSPGWLTKLNLGYSEFTRIGNIVFVPGTHQLLFNTSEVKPWNDSVSHMSPMDVQPNLDVLLMDIDTKEIKRLVAPGEGGIFQISPDGKLDIDYTGSYIDVIGIYGQINRRHMITYQPNWDNEWVEPFWTQDSSKFIFVAPIKGNADPTDGPEPDTVWQYSMESNTANEIHLNPPPMDHYFTLSPDGNWIAYSYFYYPGKTEKTMPSGVYLGNLRDGSSRFLGSAPLYGSPDSFEWSPDSEHFIFEDDRQTRLYLGNIQGDVTPLNVMGFEAGWIDSHRYIYFPSNGAGLELLMGEVGNEGNTPVVDLPAGLTNVHTGLFAYAFVKPK